MYNKFYRMVIGIFTEINCTREAPINLLLFSVLTNNLNFRIFFVFLFYVCIYACIIMSPYTRTHMYIYMYKHVYLIFTSKYLYYVTLNSSVLLLFLRYSKIVLYPHLFSPHPFFWSFQWTIGKNKDSILYGIVKVGFLGENTWQQNRYIEKSFWTGIV